MANIFRSREYFLVCLTVQRLWSAGVAEVHHDLPQAYYMCLLRLDCDALLGFCNRDVQSMTNANFLQLLHGSELCIEDAKGAVDVLALPQPQAPQPVPAHVLTTTARRLRRPRLGYPTVDVHLDMCSHASGHQRAYVACKHPGHVACFKYRQLGTFPSTAACFAWLYCWALLAPQCVSKEEHKWAFPLESDVAETLAELFP